MKMLMLKKILQKMSFILIFDHDAENGCPNDNRFQLDDGIQKVTDSASLCSNRPLLVDD